MRRTGCAICIRWVGEWTWRCHEGVRKDISIGLLGIVRAVVRVRTRTVRVVSVVVISALTFVGLDRPGSA